MDVFTPPEPEYITYINPGDIGGIDVEDLYASNAHTYFRPSNDLCAKFPSLKIKQFFRYETSNEPIVWREFDKKQRWSICCALKTDARQALHFEAVVEERVAVEVHARKMGSESRADDLWTECEMGEPGNAIGVKAYIVHLYPALKFRLGLSGSSQGILLLAEFCLCRDFAVFLYFF